MLNYVGLSRNKFPIYRVGDYLFEESYDTYRLLENDEIDDLMEVVAEEWTPDNEEDCLAEELVSELWEGDVR